MNIGKLNTMKAEKKLLYIDILGISELKWSGIGHFQWEDHTIT